MSIRTTWHKLIRNTTHFANDPLCSFIKGICSSVVNGSSWNNYNSNDDSVGNGYDNLCNVDKYVSFQ